MAFYSKGYVEQKVNAERERIVAIVKKYIDKGYNYGIQAKFKELLQEIEGEKE